MLGKQTEHMDGEQAKNCYKKCSLHFQQTCIRIFHFPMLLHPKAFPTLQNQPDQNELKLNQQREGLLLKDLAPQKLCLLMLSEWQQTKEKKRGFEV